MIKTASGHVPAIVFRNQKYLDCLDKELPRYAIHLFLENYDTKLYVAIERKDKSTGGKDYGLLIEDQHGRSSSGLPITGLTSRDNPMESLIKLVKDIKRSTMRLI